jgi:ParB family transcriptional regulator, chromosome partitioning protein
MSDRPRGLGRGLGALIPTSSREADDRPADMFFPRRTDAADDALAGPPPGPAGPPGEETVGRVPRETSASEVGPGPALRPVDGARFAELPVEAISPNPRQPRQAFDEEAMAELIDSIRTVGLLQPVVVRPLDGDRYELVMGERRWRAGRAAGLERLPAIIRSTEDIHLLRDALLENLHRTELNPLEEAAAYSQLLDDFGCTHEELASRIGRSRPVVSNTLRLLKLPPLVQRRVAAGVLSGGHARALLGLSEAAAQERLAQRIVAEGLSVRAVEEVVALGGDPALGTSPGRTARPRPPVAPRLADLAASLSERFDTRVRVDLGRRKGRITVEFATLDDLHRIVGLLDPASGAALDKETDPASPGSVSPPTDPDVGSHSAG